MKEMQEVLSNYLGLKGKYKLVPGANDEVPLRALRVDLPNIFLNTIESFGFKRDHYRVKGSSGEPNRSFALVPWVALFNRSITKSATEGYYIVLLFSEDMSAVTLSLNQGYTSFSKRYASPTLARQKLADCASAALKTASNISPDFDIGPIDLRTNGELGKGYESGSILSKRYFTDSLPSLTAFQQDFHTLLKTYLTLIDVHGASLIDLDISLDEIDILEAATKVDLTEHPNAPNQSVGPLPPPPLGNVGSKQKYARSLEVVARALNRSRATCALGKADDPHTSFVWERTKQNYVEAHHIIPFSQQKNFTYSLDVEENVVMLCPTCHRLLHHGTRAERAKHLAQLLKNRKFGLQQRGIAIPLEELLRMYGALESDD